jgi:hypothetical protein
VAQKDSFWVDEVGRRPQLGLPINPERYHIPTRCENQKLLPIRSHSPAAAPPRKNLSGPPASLIDLITEIITKILASQFHESTQGIFLFQIPEAHGAMGKAIKVKKWTKFHFALLKTPLELLLAAR